MGPVVRKNPARLAWNGSASRVWHDRQVLSAVSIVLRVVADLVGWFALALRSRRSLQAEVLFLRR